MDGASLIGMVLAPLLPGDNAVVKNVVGLGIARVVGHLWGEYGQHVRAFTRWSPYALTVDRETPIYSRLQTFVMRRFGDLMHASTLGAHSGILDTTLDGAVFSRRLYERHGEHWIEWRVQANELQLHSRTADLDTLRAYALDVAADQPVASQLSIWKAKVPSRITYSSKGKPRFAGAHWEHFRVASNRTLANTPLDKNVVSDLCDDVAWFLQHEDWYNVRGIPYKRGYFLHGPPGTGKTSVIKALANEHGLPIYTMDLASVWNTEDLATLLRFVHVRQRSAPHLLVMEDMENATVFSLRRAPYQGELTMTYLLNELDGVVETTGRILIMTTNHPSVVTESENAGALLRPGRIDRRVEIGYCTKDQYRAIFAQQFDRRCPVSIPNLSHLSPSVVVSLMQRYEGRADEYARFVCSSAFATEAAKAQRALESTQRGSRPRFMSAVQAQRAKMRRQEGRIKRILRNYRELPKEEKRLSTMEVRLNRLKRMATQKKSAANRKRKAASRPRTPPKRKVAKPSRR